MKANLKIWLYKSNSPPPVKVRQNTTL